MRPLFAPGKRAFVTPLFALLALSSQPAFAQPPPAASSAAPAPSAPPPSGSWYQEVSRLMAQADRRMNAGDHEAAIKLLERALAISEENKHDDYIALVLSQLTQAYTAKRDPAKVDDLHRRILSIREKKDGPKSPFVAMALLNYGNFCRQTGQLDRAEGLLTRAASIYEAAGGPSGLSAALALNELALIHVSRGRETAAEALLARALDLQEKAAVALNVDVPAIGNTLANMAILAHHRGELDRALDLNRRACAIVEKAAKTPEHYAVAQCIHNLGLVHLSRGDHPAAKDHLDRANGVWQRVLGPEHPRLTVSLNGLASYHEARGETDKALAVLERSADLNDRDLDLVLASGSEGQKRDFIARIAGQTDGILSLHAAASKDAASPSAAASRRLALGTLLRRKGRILDAVAGTSAALRLRMNAEDRAVFDELSAARAELARLILGGIRGADEATRAKVEALKQTIERLEAELSRRSAPFRAAAQPVSIERVMEAIPSGALLIEIARYRPFNAAWKTMAEAWKPARYAAFLLAKDAEPESVDLGEAKAIDDAVAKLRRALADRGGAPGNAFLKSLARDLDERVLRPILAKARASSAGARPSMLLVSPAGSLNLIPLGALVDEAGRYRVESYPIAYFTTGRDLLRIAASPGGVAAAQKTGAGAAPNAANAPNAPSVVIGDPGFGDPAPRPKSGASRRAVEMFFSPLPGTAEEAQVIASVLPGATLFTGARATEAAVKEGRAPYVLHIATHGFFLGEPDAGAAAPGQSRALELEMSSPAAGGGSAPKTSSFPIEQPLLRSGLAFAGANRQGSGGAGGDDGILTALEASGLDLWGTELVVLSACETGLGDVTDGEGVYGLRRSLIIAGARSQVMSLWKVDDEATRDLMVDFYRNLSAGQGRAEALRSAQLAMLQTPARSHPFYWASFIPSGDWRELHLPAIPAALPRPAPRPPAPPSASPGARGCGCDLRPSPRPSGVASLSLLALAAAAARALRSRRPPIR
ncbi:MAG TPA: CHAT domain-containing tetratricopeptide repeat protein [Polyangiaceae bacterium]|nr:CHAT domain-containing tetratricopeptide repeat protein [Polyangiaceae bacterium]